MPPWKESSEAMLMTLPPLPSASMRFATPCQEEGRFQVDVHHRVPIGLGEVDGVGGG
jgi:hypothetical protein